MMKKRHVIYGLSFALFVFSVSCEEILNIDVVGDGNLAGENRILPDFTSVYLDTDFKVYLTSGDEYGVEVEADSNLLQYINTEVTGGVLTISSNPNFDVQPRHPVSVYLRVPDGFSGVEVINGGKIEADSLYTDSLDVRLYGVSSFSGKRMESPVKLFLEGSTRISMEGEFEDLIIRQRGSGNINLEGTSGFGDVLLEGSGKINAKNMKIDDADIRIYGSGLVFCDVSGFLKARVDGSGRIYYYGTPGKLEKEVVGDGLIVPANN
ncbi:MAG: head GIN domain-containing protein [Marinilabilia sp.]